MTEEQGRGKTTARRDKFEVIAVILTNIEGQGVASIMREAGLSFSLTKQYLETLMEKRFIEKAPGPGTKEVYKITSLGALLLDQIKELLSTWES